VTGTNGPFQEGVLSFRLTLSHRVGPRGVRVLAGVPRRMPFTNSPHRPRKACSCDECVQVVLFAGHQRAGVVLEEELKTRRPPFPRAVAEDGLEPFLLRHGVRPEQAFGVFILGDMPQLSLKCKPPATRVHCRQHSRRSFPGVFTYRFGRVAQKLVQRVQKIGDIPVDRVRLVEGGEDREQGGFGHGRTFLVNVNKTQRWAWLLAAAASGARVFMGLIFRSGSGRPNTVLLRCFAVIALPQKLSSEFSRAALRASRALSLGGELELKRLYGLRRDERIGTARSLLSSQSVLRTLLQRSESFAIRSACLLFARKF
jgi:hypothetical protein